MVVKARMRNMKYGNHFIDSNFPKFLRRNKTYRTVTFNKETIASESNFTITAEILARSWLICTVNMRIDTTIYATRQRAREGNLTICYRKKQIDASF